MGKLFFPILFSGILFLCGCAVKPYYPSGQDLLRGQDPNKNQNQNQNHFPPIPDSVRAELELTAFHQKQKSSVTAAFSSIPRSDYKLDIFGLPGMVAASFLWQKNLWSMVLYDDQTFAQDSGEHVEFGNLGIHEMSIHDLFAFLWGDFFPGLSLGSSFGSTVQFEKYSNPRNVNPENENQPNPNAVNQNIPSHGKNLMLRYQVKGQSWFAEIDSISGLVQSVTRQDSAFRITYEDYRSQKSKGREPFPIPEKTSIYSRQGLLLEIKVKSLERNPHWRKNPFFIKIPKTFHLLKKVDYPEPS